MTKRGIILGHVLVFVVLAAVHVLLIAEPCVAALIPGHHQVEHWLVVVGFGVTLIMLVCLGSTLLMLRRSR
ncbi:MAG TPA: hypothetical protein PKE21_05995 [Flavobacteriales bacterium]|nr:hypothetical protein [Flavobacteriales bacterium]HMR27010.1 hypothetical protein [Flavobacteriales bacterium]